MIKVEILCSKDPTGEPRMGFNLAVSHDSNSIEIATAVAAIESVKLRLLDQMKFNEMQTKLPPKKKGKKEDDDAEG